MYEGLTPEQIAEILINKIASGAGEVEYWYEYVISDKNEAIAVIAAAIREERQRRDVAIKAAVRSSLTPRSPDTP